MSRTFGTTGKTRTSKTKSTCRKASAFLCKCVCKPGSVLDGHQSTHAIADVLQPPPENGRAGLVFSHGVAPDRVYSIPMLPWGRVRSYRTFPPFPEVLPSGSLFLLHLSEGHPWRALPVILALWSPDFPHAQAFALCPRPSGALAESFYTLLPE